MPRPSKAGRDYGAGSIYQECVAACPPREPNDEGKMERPKHRCTGPWVGALQAGWNERGVRRRIKVKGKTEAEVKTRIAQRKQLIGDAMRQNVNPRTTIKAWSEEWLPIVELKQRPSTHSTTRTAVRKWIVPTIGHRRFDELTPADLRAVTKALRAAGTNSSTQLRYHSVLMELLRSARLEGYPVPPALFDVDSPTKAVSNRTSLGVENATAVLVAAAETPDSSRWIASLLQGMRQAERLGLTDEFVDLKRGTMTLAWQLQPLPYRVRYDRSSGFRVPDGFDARQVEGRLHLVRPKSKAGWRVIPLVPWMRTTLEAWMEVRPENPHGLVWPTEAGRPMTTKRDDQDWYALQEAAGVQHASGRRFTIHEARHTTASLLLQAKVDPTTITAILGHSNYATSQSYMHVDVESALDALAEVAKRLQLG